MLDNITGVSKGFGFVRFATASQGTLVLVSFQLFTNSFLAQQAIQHMDGETVGGKKLACKFAEPDKLTQNPLGTPSKNLFVKNLPLNISPDQLLHLFSSYGAIIRHKILKDFNSTGGMLSRGQAFIEYEAQTSANNALASK